MRFKTMIVAALVVALAAPVAAKQVPNSNQMARSREAVAEIDVDRLFSDKTYAAARLTDLDRVRSFAESDDFAANIELMRTIALMTLGRVDEASKAAELAVALHPSNPGHHFFAILTRIGRQPESALAALERAERSLGSETARADLLAMLENPVVFSILRPAKVANDEATMARAARVLLALGWPKDQPDLRDSLYLDLINHALTAGKADEAGANAALVTNIKATVQLLVTQRYAPIFWTGDPTTQVASAIANEDRQSSDIVARKPNDHRGLVQRAAYLRAVGRDEAALKLLEPKLEGVLSGRDEGEDGFWLVNEAAYALAALGRPDEAMALMKRLLALPFDQNPELISMSINAIEVMMQAGKHAEAAAHSEALAARPKNYASPFGMMWIWGGAACAYSLLGKPDKAKPWLVKLKAGEKDNGAALTRALLCANELDAAAALLVRRLGGPDASDVLVAVQDYQLVGKGPANLTELEHRWAAVLARPEVKAAIARHGRILKLPLARSYYGAF